MTCEKITYDTHQEAIDHARGSSKRLRQGFKVYQCRDCFKYHVHTLPKKKLKDPPREKHKKEYYDNMIAAKRPQKIDRGNQLKEPLRPNRKFVPATQKLISPLQAEILKAIIENGNRKER